MVLINSEENGELLPKQPGWEDTGRKIKGLLSRKQGSLWQLKQQGWKHHPRAEPTLGHEEQLSSECPELSKQKSTCRQDPRLLVGFLPGGQKGKRES